MKLQINNNIPESLYKFEVVVGDFLSSCTGKALKAFCKKVPQSKLKNLVYVEGKSGELFGFSWRGSKGLGSFLPLVKRLSDESLGYKIVVDPAVAELNEQYEITILAPDGSEILGLADAVLFRLGDGHATSNQALPLLKPRFAKFALYCVPNGENNLLDSRYVLKVKGKSKKACRCELKLDDASKILRLVVKEEIMEEKELNSVLNISLGEVEIAWSDLAKIRTGSEIELAAADQIIAKLRVGESEFATAALKFEDGALKLEVISMGYEKNTKNLSDEETFKQNQRLINSLLTE